MPFLGGLGFWEILLIMMVLLLVFGAKRLPELGGSLGKGIREFKRSVKDIEGELRRPLDDETPSIRPAQRSTPAVPPPGETTTTSTPDDTRP